PAARVDWPFWIGPRADEACFAGNRGDRRRCRARSDAGRRGSRRADQGPGFNQPAQCRAGDFRWPAEDEGSVRSGAVAGQAGGRTVKVWSFEFRVMATKKPKKEAGAAKIKIQYYRSVIAFPTKQKEIVRSLGLHKLNQVVERPDTASMRGAVAKVPHLLRIIE